jgi:hypothetical protein
MIKRTLGAALIALFVVLAAAGAAVPNPDPSLIAEWAPCDPGAGVTVIVDNQTLGDHEVHVRCAPGAQATGVDALQHAGFDPAGTDRWGLAFICRIAGLPTAATEPCRDTPPASAYWSYWKGRPGGQWVYSAWGAAAPQNAVPLGSVEGWSFSTTSPSPEPRVLPQDSAGNQLTLLPTDDGQQAATDARAWLTRQAAAIVQAATPTSNRATMALLVGSPAAAGGAERNTLQALADSGDDPADTAAVLAFVQANAQAYATKSDTATLANTAYPEQLSRAILGIVAAGGDPSSPLDLRGTLVDLMPADVTTDLGRVQQKSNGIRSSRATTLSTQAMTVLALARSGEVPRRAVDYLLGTQQASGEFANAVTTVISRRIETAQAIVALDAARSAGSTGLDDAISAAATWLAQWQRADGALLNLNASGQISAPSVALAAIAARAFAAAGRTAEAERAATYLSSLQLVPTVTGEGVASADDGAVAPTEAGVADALRNGVDPTRADFRAATADALLAFARVPFGRAHLTLNPELPLFGARTVGSTGTALPVTVTSTDRRALLVQEVAVSGAQDADFRVVDDGCSGQTLTRGDTCTVTIAFGPRATGLRSASLRVALGGIDQPVVLALSGQATAVPAPVTATPEPGAPATTPAPDAPQTQTQPQPDAPAPVPASAPQASPVAPRGTITPRRGGSPLARGGSARLGTLTCPAGASCTVTAPKRVTVTLDGHRYRVAVLAPRTIAAGRSAALGVRLPRAAVRHLRQAGVVVRVPVAVGTARRTVAVRVRP